MILIYIISVIWCIRLLLNLLSYIQLWYVKEYRFDRMLIHLKTKQGRRLLFLPWRRPPIKPKSCVVFAGSVVVLLGIYLLLPSFILWKLFIMDILLFPITAVFVFIVKVPTLVYHKLLIRKAVRKLRSHSKMTVIGITGSYGKTSTKEILATILGTKFQTLKTEASKNSPIGIAEIVLSKLQPQHEVFIVEMGAYKRGEIAQMCAIVRPDTGIVTAINEQHQDLFGSMAETVKAKYELIEGLNGKKIAIFNADNTYTNKMAVRAKDDGRDVICYSLQKVAAEEFPNILHAVNVQSLTSGISFTLQYNKESIKAVVHLLGRHQVSNILAASAAAVSSGMTLSETVKAYKSIRPFAHTMNPLSGINGSTFIDDTFNNNPDAARAAIDYLKITKGKKILVFQPMIELGSFASIRHKEVGAYAGAVCDEIILTNDSYREDFISGASASGGDAHVFVMNPADAVKHLRKITRQGDTVLFKGKEAARTLKILV